MWRIKYTWRYSLGHNDRTFCKIFMMGLITMIVVLSLVGCRGPVEFYPIQDSWVNPFSDKPIPMEQVCDACGVDHTLLDAAGVGILNERYQTVKEW